MCRRAEQIAKASEGRWPNHITIELSQHKPIRILICEDTEMILPEVDHHFVQLPLAVNRAQ